MANKTVQELYTMADDLLRQDGNTSGVPGLESSAVITWVNDLHRQYFDEYTTTFGNLPPYMKREKGYTGVSGTETAAAIAAAATSFTIDSSSALDTSGAGVIYSNNQYDIFTHTGNSGGTVSGVAASGLGAIDFAHAADETVCKLYALPTNFGRLRPEKDRGDGVRVNGRGYYQTPDMPTGFYFSLWQDASSNWYLWMPKGTSDDILVTYDAIPTALTATTSNIDIPAQYTDYWYIVWGLVALFKQILDEEYVPSKELQQQKRVLQAAFNRNKTAKKVSASNSYFSRYGL